MSKVFGFFADVYMFLYERNKVPFYLKTVTSIRFFFFNLHVIWLMNVAKKYLCRVYTYIYGNWSSNNDSHLQSRYINLNHIYILTGNVLAPFRNYFFVVAGVTQEYDVGLSISPLAIQTSAIRHQWNLSKCMLCHPPLKHFDTFTRYCQKHFFNP